MQINALVRPFTRLIAFGLSASVLIAILPNTSALAQTEAPTSARLDDVAMLKREYLTKEQALSPAALERARQLISRVEGRAELKTDAEFELAAMQLTALANSGGSLVVPAGPQAGQARLPIKLGLFNDGLLVIRGKGEAHALAGAKILAIDGRPVEQVVARLTHFFGGAQPRRESLLPMMIEIPALMHAAGLTKQPDRMQLRLSLSDGRETEIELEAAAAPLGGPGWWPDRWSADGYDTDWSYTNPGKMPLYLTDFETAFRAIPLEGGHFVQLKWTPDWDREAGLKQVSDALETIKGRSNRFVVFDLRFDHGASSPEIAEAMADAVSALPPTTKIYLLVGRYTHHNGIGTAATIMKAGGSRATAIGEDMGDWLNGPRWAGRLCLKSVTVCPTFSQMPEGVSGEIVRQSPPFAILPAPPTARSLREGRDPALDLTLKLATGPQANRS